MKILGVDEAGKGPVIGPLVVCGVLCDEKEIEQLEKIGVKDSKKLSPKKRDEIYSKLKSMVEYEAVIFNAIELDEKMQSKTINEILMDAVAEIIKKFNPDVVYVDSFDVKPERLSEELKNKTGKKVIALHNGERIPVVASASIIAKTIRERLVEELKKIYGDFGSGYASDERTIKWLEERLKRGELPEIVRKRWKTVENLRKKLGQKKLFEF